MRIFLVHRGDEIMSRHFAQRIHDPLKKLDAAFGHGMHHDGQLGAAHFEFAQRIEYVFLDPLVKRFFKYNGDVGEIEIGSCGAGRGRQWRERDVAWVMD